MTKRQLLELLKGFPASTEVRLVIETRDGDTVRSPIRHIRFHYDVPRKRFAYLEIEGDGGVIEEPSDLCDVAQQERQNG